MMSSNIASARLIDRSHDMARQGGIECRTAHKKTRRARRAARGRAQPRPGVPWRARPMPLPSPRNEPIARLHLGMPLHPLHRGCTSDMRTSSRIAHSRDVIFPNTGCIRSHGIRSRDARTPNVPLPHPVGGITWAAHLFLGRVAPPLDSR